MLKVSKVKIELISDPELNNFFRDSIRGGMSFVAKRYSKSGYTKLDDINNSKNKNKNHIRYIDCNNLYGSMMLFDMPVGNYKFESLKINYKN